MWFYSNIIYDTQITHIRILYFDQTNTQIKSHGGTTGLTIGDAISIAGDVDITGTITATSGLGGGRGNFDAALYCTKADLDTIGVSSLKHTSVFFINSFHWPHMAHHSHTLR